MAKIRKIVIVDWDGCGLQVGRVDGDVAYFYEDDYMFIEAEDGWLSTSCGEIRRMDDEEGRALIKENLEAWISEFIRELEKEGYEVEITEIEDRKFGFDSSEFHIF